MQSAAKDVQYFQLPTLGSALVTYWYTSILESYNYDSEKQSGLNTELTCDHNYIISQAKKGVPARVATLSLEKAGFDKVSDSYHYKGNQRPWVMFQHSKCVSLERSNSHHSMEPPVDQAQFS